jgi:hypothetical protein
VGEGFRGGDIAAGLGDLARQNAGTYILTASTAIQLAEERESAASDGNGIFTKYFIEAQKRSKSELRRPATVMKLRSTLPTPWRRGIGDRCWRRANCGASLGLG